MGAHRATAGDVLNTQGLTLLPLGAWASMRETDGTLEASAGVLIAPERRIRASQNFSSDGKLQTLVICEEHRA